MRGGICFPDGQLLGWIGEGLIGVGGTGKYGPLGGEVGEAGLIGVDGTGKYGPLEGVVDGAGPIGGKSPPGRSGGGLGTKGNTGKAGGGGGGGGLSRSFGLLAGGGLGMDSPDGSECMLGEFPTYRYMFTSPASNRIGSICMNRPITGE